MGARYVDERYADNANAQSAPGYTVVDATIGWQFLPQVKVGLQVNNLFDREYVQAAFSGQQWLMGTPRSTLRRWTTASEAGSPGWRSAASRRKANPALSKNLPVHGHMDIT